MARFTAAGVVVLLSLAALLAYIARQAGTPKVKVGLSDVRLVSPGKLRVRIETGPLTDSEHAAEIFAAVALNSARSTVARGENAGRDLSHAAVVRSWTRIGQVRAGQSCAQDTEIKLPASTDPHNLRLIIFLQQPNQGRVLGAAQVLLSQARP